MIWLLRQLQSLISLPSSEGFLARAEFFLTRVSEGILFRGISALFNFFSRQLLQQQHLQACCCLEFCKCVTIWNARSPTSNRATSNRSSTRFGFELNVLNASRRARRKSLKVDIDQLNVFLKWQHPLKP